MMKKLKFTLIELLVVIAIIGILASLLLPSLRKAKTKAQLKVTINNLKQLGISHYLYLDDSDERFIVSRVHTNVNYSWDDILASYIGYSLTEAEKEASKSPYRSTFDVLSCPLDDIDRYGGAYTRTFQLNGYTAVGVSSMFGYTFTDSMNLAQVSEPSETIMMNEHSKSNNWVGGASNVIMVGGNITEVTTGIKLSGGVTYNANHHQNDYRNGLLYVDGRANVIDMRTTRFESDYLWRSSK